MKTIEITWNVNTEPDMQSYLVYENDVLVQTIAHPTTICTLTRADGNYSYSIAARDTSGNISERTTPITIKIDTVPPTVPTGLKAIIKN
jgi:chitodextrinase